ncbi:hypothetical protein [Olleya sp. HaHaR_3_96]|uniref:hypothetical protein n=1 Tax=Olleya sp. HaHaR_3_96 TaxID=2745560 RepID=UPI001C4E5D2F|nr:hypothetical protein [Olleya sp. HaHaR_3_96]QXP58273.1 hypothetical protein H0I26_10095 [Olleya sp. HaHaR_3_96]
MGRKIGFPKIDKNTQKVIERMSEFSDMVKKEEHETLLPSNVVSVNELRKDIERNNKKSEKSSKRAKEINIVMLLIALFSILYVIYKDFNDEENEKKLETIELKTLYLEQNIENYQRQLREIKNELNLLIIEQNDSLK